MARRNMMKRILMMLGMVALLLLSACDPPQQPTPPDEPAPATQSAEVTLYYVNKAYLEYGDEKEEHLIPVQQTLTLQVEGGSFEPKDLIEGIFESLKQVPEGDRLTTALKSELKLISGELDGDMVILNISSENLSGGGTEEAMLIDQLVATYLEIEGVTRMQMLIDGAVAETLMGHIGIAEPFDKSWLEAA